MSCSARWFFDILSWKPCAGELALALDSIQTEERTRIERFVYKRDAFASLAGRLLARTYCNKATGVRWKELLVDRDPNGKPYLVGKDGVAFNISHQGGYVVLAGETASVDLLGIDVMKQEYTGGKPLSQFFRLMNKNFSESEWKWITALKNSNGEIRRFYRLWTLKESYVKATGTGITVPLDRIEFYPLSPLSKESFVEDTRVRVGTENVDGWVFQEMQLDDVHCVSVAMRTSRTVLHKQRPVRFTQLSFNDMVPYFQPLATDSSALAQAILDKPFSPS